MKHLLKKRLASLQAQLLETRSDLAGVRVYLSFAKADVAHHAQREQVLTDKLDAERQIAGGLWLDLMTSGISHRRFLKFVEEHGG